MKQVSKHFHIWAIAGPSSVLQAGLENKSSGWAYRRNVSRQNENKCPVWSLARTADWVSCIKKKKCCGVPNGLGFGFVLQMRGEVSSQSRKGNQTVCLVSEVAFEAINELESEFVHWEVPLSFDLSEVARSWNHRGSCGKERNMTRGKEAAGELGDGKSSSGFCCYPLSLSHCERKELCLCTAFISSLWFCVRGH